jgi:hypothetical protein
MPLIEDRSRPSSMAVASKGHAIGRTRLDGTYEIR